jgi:hypothetical protein
VAQSSREDPERMGDDTSSKVVAELRRRDGEVELAIGRSVIDIGSLGAESREWLAKRSPPLLIEVLVERRAGALVAIGLGAPHPHPRVAALRAVADQRYGDALEALAVIESIVDDDPELLAARVIARARTRTTEAVADLLRLCELADATPEQLRSAHAAIPQASSEEASVGLVSRITADLARASQPRNALLRALGGVPRERWSVPALLAGIEEALGARAVEEAAQLLAVARSRSSEPAVAAAAERIEAARKKALAAEQRRIAKLRAGRPDIGEIESLFGTTLPSALRDAWSAAYDGRANEALGATFLDTPRARLPLLRTLATKLERAVAADLARNDRGSPMPRLLPFARGEHDDEYFALDLESGGVWVAFLGRGEGWRVYDGVDEWLAAGGATRY